MLTKIVLVLPAETDLQVVVVDNQTDEPLQQVVTLFFGQSINLADVVTDGEDTLPAGHGVGADDRVDGRQVVADVVGAASRFGVQLKLVVLGALVEGGLRICCVKGLEELLIWPGDAVVDFIAGGPEGIFDLQYISSRSVRMARKGRRYLHQFWAARSSVG